MYCTTYLACAGEDGGDGNLVDGGGTGHEGYEMGHEGVVRVDHVDGGLRVRGHRPNAAETRLHQLGTSTGFGAGEHGDQDWEDAVVDELLAMVVTSLGQGPESMGEVHLQGTGCGVLHA